MPTFRVTNLANFGYQPDATPSTIPDNAFSRSENWRYNQAGYAEVTEGYTNLYESYLQTPYFPENTEATFLCSWNRADGPGLIIYDRQVVNDAQGNPIAALSKQLKLVEIPQGSTALVTTALDSRSTSYTDRTLDFLWQFTEIFGQPILNDTVRPPFIYQERTATEAPEVTPLSTFGSGMGWPETATCKFITSHASFLIALGYVDTQTDPAITPPEFRGGRKVIAISDNIPPDSTLPLWDFANNNEQAITFAQLIDLSTHTDGELVSAYEFGNVLYINTTTNILELVYQGSNGIWTVSVLPFPNGVLSAKASTLIPNGFFNLGDNVAYTHDGSSSVNVGEGIWSRTMFSHINPARMDEVECTYDSRSKSVWIKIPRNMDVTEIWIYNLENETVSLLASNKLNELKQLSFSHTGFPSIPVTWENLDIRLRWNSWYGSWNSIPTTTESATSINSLIALGERQLFLMEEGDTFGEGDGNAIEAILGRQDFQVDTNTYFTFQMNRVIPWIIPPDSNVPTKLEITVAGSRNAVGDPAFDYQTTKVLDVNTQEKVDVRKTVKWGAIEFRSTTPKHRLSGYEIEYQPRSRR